MNINRKPPPGSTDRALDDALSDTFPAFDPVAMEEPKRAPAAQTPVTETATQARQGVTGHNVRYVLRIGTLGVIAAFVVIYVIYFA